PRIPEPGARRAARTRRDSLLLRRLHGPGDGGPEPRAVTPAGGQPAFPRRPVASESARGRFSGPSEGAKLAGGSPMETPRFAVDRMLGRLARWLCLLGFDALYRPELPGRRLITLAAREGRVVLTRDRALERVRSPVEVVLIESDRFRDQ